MSRIGNVGHRLYTGEVSVDFVGRKRYWYAFSAVLLIISITALFTRGLSLGIEFKGGTDFTIRNAASISIDAAKDTVMSAGVAEPTVKRLTSATVNSLRIETEPLDQAQVSEVKSAIMSQFNVTDAEIEQRTVGSSWGAQITEKAIKSLIVFIIAIIAYLSIRYEWKMAVAANVALLHDLIVTVGIYALVGFQVTPATVIGFLTILGYSLYDTVVVFDKVRENTQGLAGGSRMTYSQAANLGVNQTLVRSINTSIVGLLPVASLLFIGGGIMQADTLEDLALALFVGIATGTYSSIFIATPLAATLKEREPQFKALAKRVAARQNPAARQPVAAGVGVVGSAPDDAPEKPDAAARPSAEAEADAPQRPTPAATRRPPQQRPGGQRRPSGSGKGKKRRR